MTDVHLGDLEQVHDRSYVDVRQTVPGIDPEVFVLCQDRGQVQSVDLLTDGGLSFGVGIITGVQLDPVGARQIKDVIRELGRKGKTILLSSHVLSDVEDVSDRVTILYGGRQQAAGDIADLLRKRDVTQITTPPLSEETIEKLRDLIQRLERKDIMEVSNPRQRLEDFFLQIVEEAQAANIRTSGATAGGEIPDFLKQATGSTTDEIIESLVTAASRPVQPEREDDPPPRERRDAEPGREVLAQLLGEPTEEDEEFTGPELPARAPAPRPASTPIRADESIIESLLKRADDKVGEKGESSP